MARKRNPPARPGQARPWTEAEDELIRTLKPSEAARRTGRTLSAVYARRYILYRRGERFGRRG
jgi:hypothetical protein